MPQEYNISFPQGTTPYGESQTPASRKTRSSFFGCFGITGTIVIVVLIIIAGYYFVYPALTPNNIRGSLLDFAIVPQKDGSSRLWVLTDGSFNFIQTTKSPGSYSTGRKCFFCKTWMYVVDPTNQNVLKKTKTEYEDIITTTNLVYSNGKVYQITYGYGSNEPKIVIANAETGDVISDTKDFIAKYSELSSGLADVHYNKDENIIQMKTKDGRTDVTYSLDKEIMYPKYSDYTDEMEKDPAPGSIFALGAESMSGPRKILYIIKGPKGVLKRNKSSMDSYVTNESTLEFFVKGATGQKLSDKAYLEGIIYYQDHDCAIIIHVDQMGKVADRMMTCIDNNGKEKWTIPQDDLFKQMKVNEQKDSFSSIFFTKDKIGVIRSGNLVVLKLQGEGVMGFDFNSGKKLFTMNI
jgi:hypothetical protein